MKILLTLLVSLAPLAATTAPSSQPEGSPAAPLAALAALDGAAAQGGCFNMWYCTGGHYMLQGPIGAYRFHHGECMVCIDEGGCHPGCFDADAGKKVDYSRMVAAAESADLQGLLDAAETLPEYVYFNAERSSVQVLACDQRTIIASVPVLGSAKLVAAARLPNTAALQVMVGE